MPPHATTVGCRQCVGTSTGWRVVRVLQQPKCDNGSGAVFLVESTTGSKKRIVMKLTGVTEFRCVQRVFRAVNTSGATARFPIPSGHVLSQPLDDRKVPVLYALFMEYVPHSLASFACADPRRMRHLLVRLWLDYVNGLHRLHTLGLLHMDVCPQNLAVRAKPHRGVILDLGNSKPISYPARSRGRLAGLLVPVGSVAREAFAAVALHQRMDELTPAAHASDDFEALFYSMLQALLGKNDVWMGVPRPASDSQSAPTCSLGARERDIFACKRKAPTALRLGNKPFHVLPRTLRVSLANTLEVIWQLRRDVAANNALPTSALVTLRRAILQCHGD